MPRICVAGAIQYVSQATEPVLTANSQVILWNDSTTGRKWLVSFMGGVQVKVEQS